MNKRVKYIVLCLQFFAVAAQTGAQQLRFQRFSVEDGLHNNIVFAATQDAKGFMWFATGTGIDRFDGNKFVHYALPQKNNTRSEYLQIQHILVDEKKQVWAASVNSLFSYNVKKDAFELPQAINTWLEKNKTVTCLATTSDSKQLLIGNNNGLTLYKPAEQKVVATEKFNHYIRSIYQDSSGVVWVGSNKGVHRLIINGNGINPLPQEIPLLDKLQPMSITGISQDERGRYWFVTADKGIYVYDQRNQTLEQLNLPKTSLRMYAVKDVYHNTGEGLTYVTLDGGGLALMDRELNLQGVYQTNEDDPTTLSNNAGYDVFNDQYNRIWITTYGGGVNMISPAVQPFTNFSHQINNNNSLSNNAAKAVTESNDGSWWFGTRKGISRYSPGTQQWRHFNEDARLPGYTADNILALANGNSGIWAATYGGGLMRIDAPSGRITSYTNNPSDSSSIGTDFVYAVLSDSKQRVWSGGIRGPVSYFEQSTNRFTRVATPVAAVNCIIEDSKGQILLGTEKGVFAVADNTLANFFPGVVTERVLYILEYSPGTYWLGTLGNGILVVNKEKGIVQRLGTANGLPSDVVCGMLKDKKGDVWAGTSKGVAHYQTAAKTFTVYTKADGLAGTQVNYGAMYASQKGEMMVGTTDGFSLFNPESINAKAYKPVILLTGLAVNNKQILPADEGSPLKEHLDETDKLVLRYYQNSFSIDFVNASPSTSGKHLYSWKLEGFDKDWSQPSTVPTAAYSNLNSGAYTLLLKAFAKGQAADAQVRKLYITIKSPWWKTGWAYMGYLLLLVAGGLAFYNYKNIKRTRKKYAERLQLNTSISHEIRTPLTLIKGPVNALANTAHLSEGDRANLELAKKNIEKLEGIISQFIDYQKTGMRKMQMQVTKADATALLDDITASFVPLMKEKNIHFTYTKPSEPILLLFDKDKLEKVLNNLLSNAVKYTPAQKDIAVSVNKDAKDLIVQVADTGIGIPADQQRYIFNGYFRADNTINLKETGSGIGLNVAKELVEMHRGRLEFTSEAGKGSTFTVRLPLHNEALQQFLVKPSLAANGLEVPNINPPEIKKTGSKRILIAEDNDELRAYLRSELEQAGYKVTDAANGALALAALQKQPADLIITDVMMPEMNGFQLCATIKREVGTCHIPVIMLTAIHDRDYLLEGYRSGADDYVKKPFDLAHIITRIENLLQNRTRFRNKIMSVFEQEETVATNDADVGWLKTATELIVENLDEPDFSVEKLSSLMAMSRPVLFRRFKAITGESPQQYINQVRLRKAVELLQGRQHNINEVAFECGFSDPKYFSTTFKKHFGKSPREYQQENMGHQL
jgi:signal transduction histidine kinase/ligand-binding sensor domain-containing protein/CheY-like chemotaxis protein/AraC-like DNA-binding protein